MPLAKLFVLFQMDLQVLLAFVAASFALAITPGPDTIFVFTMSLTQGRQRGLAVVAGLMLGCLVHTSFVAFGLSTLIHENDQLFSVIKLLGAGYLLFLAFLAFRKSKKWDYEVGERKKERYAKLLQKGFLMNVLNPKVTIFFVAFFPGFLFSQHLSNISQFYVLGLLFIIVSSIVFGVVAYCAGTIARFTKNTPDSGKLFKWLQTVVFVGIAIFLLLG